MSNSSKEYAKAGVDIDLAGRLLDDVKPELKEATRPEVLGGIGAFGGLFDISKLKVEDPVLVASTDGVGTKVKLAFDSGLNDGIGYDIVNHCCNDIAVMGAEPLFFLDYYATGKLDDKSYTAVLRGLARACKAANCALLGGETAEMPGFYKEGEYDLVGTIVGVVSKSRILTGEAVRPGDRIIGLGSSGLHTNGYSLGRKIIFDKLQHKPEEKLPGSTETFAEAMLHPHVNYSPLLQSLFRNFNNNKSFTEREDNAVFAACHITGGGFTGNIPRILPKNCDAIIRTESWKKLPIFEYYIEKGGVSYEELYEVFNMGVGMVLIVSPEKFEAVYNHCANSEHRVWEIGEVVEGSGTVQLQQ